MNGLDKLRDIGLQELYRTTHIPQTHLQALLHESFDEFTTVQFLGFISILEREYNLDLSYLKEKGLKYIEENNIVQEPKQDDYKEPIKKPNQKIIYIVIAVILSILLFIISQSSSDEEKNIKIPKITKIPTKIYVENEFEKQEIVEENQTLQPKKVDIKEKPKTKQKVEQPKQVQKTVVAKKEKKDTPTKHTLKIITKQKLWLGYIELPSHKHHSRFLKGTLELNTSKDWLILTAHGYMSIDVDNNITKFREKKRMRFLYKDNQLKQISLKEFKKLNKGKAW